MPLEKAVELPVYKVYDMAQIFRALFELDSIYVYNQFLAVRVVLNPLFVAVVEPLQVIEPDGLKANEYCGAYDVWKDRLNQVVTIN